jgi:DNA-binding transcriptional ArsR family regulator
MTEYLPGGRRRVDRVLGPQFLQDLTGLPLEEIRARRVDADTEEADLSYARRLLQGRIDILRAELAGRHGDGPLAGQPGLPHSDEEIVGALSRILGAESRSDHGMGRYLGAQPTRIGEHRREAERAVADVGGSDLAALEELELLEAIERLVSIEVRVSRTRREVQRVVDTLTQEVARRYMSGEVAVGSTVEPGA